MPLAPGARLGPYEVIAAIGAGGMGEVYRAKDTRLGRTAAVKVLPADLAANAGARERLEREAQAISALTHPNVCTLFDVGHQDGTDYLVMESWVDRQGRPEFLPLDPGYYGDPKLSPDGRRIVFSSSQDVTRPTLYWVDPASGEEPEMLSRDGEVQLPASWSPDGTTLAYATTSRRTGGTSSW